MFASVKMLEMLHWKILHGNRNSMNRKSIKERKKSLKHLFPEVLGRIKFLNQCPLRVSSFKEDFTVSDILTLLEQ